MELLSLPQLGSCSRPFSKLLRCPLVSAGRFCRAAVGFSLLASGRAQGQRAGLRYGPGLCSRAWLSLGWPEVVLRASGIFQPALTSSRPCCVSLLQRDDMEAIPGYLSLHQTADIMALKWTPNQLMNGSVGDLDYEKR